MSILPNEEFKIPHILNPKPTSKESNRSRNNSYSKQKKPFLHAGQAILQSPSHLNSNKIPHKSYKEFQCAIDNPMTVKSEKKIGRNESREGNRKYPPKQKTKQNQDNELASLMAERIKKVEKEHENLSKQLKVFFEQCQEKKGVIEKLKEENQFLKGFRENSEHACNEFSQLKSKNSELSKRVQEMEEYLKKNGLKWVGNSIQGKLNHEKIKKDIKNSKHNYRLPTEIDIGTIRRRVEELNGGLHSEGYGTEIYVENGIHKFRKAQALPLSFYGNGIQIKGYNFYWYKDKESLKILTDLVDGYFPYVLKEKYPNGVFLEVVDKIQSRYDSDTNQNVRSLKEMQNQLKIDPPKQKLPKAPSSKKLQQQKQIKDFIPEESDQFQQIDGCYVFKTVTHEKIERNDITTEQICTLKIRTETGKICILEIEKQSRIKEVYKWMQKVVDKKFKIMGNFPPKTYEQSEKATLDELGFFPNATLHIQLIA